MVKFGADQILSGKGGTYTDEDIDALIAKGEERTSAMQAKLKTDAQHNLASFSLLGDENPELDTFAFDGENYREKQKQDGMFINLPQRERKRNYDVNEYFRDAMNQPGPSKGGENAKKRRRKETAYDDFQLFNKERLEYFNTKERDFASKRDDLLNSINALREKAKNAPSLHNSRIYVSSGESREAILESADQMEKSLQMFSLTDGKYSHSTSVLSLLKFFFFIALFSKSNF